MLLLPSSLCMHNLFHFCLTMLFHYKVFFRYVIKVHPPWFGGLTQSGQGSKSNCENWPLTFCLAWHSPFQSAEARGMVSCVPCIITFQSVEVSQFVDEGVWWCTCLFYPEVEVCPITIPLNCCQPHSCWDQRHQVTQPLQFARFTTTQNSQYWFDVPKVLLDPVIESTMADLEIPVCSVLMKPEPWPIWWQGHVARWVQ